MTARARRQETEATLEDAALARDRQRFPVKHELVEILLEELELEHADHDRLALERFACVIGSFPGDPSKDVVDQVVGRIAAIRAQAQR